MWICPECKKEIPLFHQEKPHWEFEVLYHLYWKHGFSI